MQSSYHKPIHAELSDIASYCEQANSASEVHGIFTGLLCRDPFTPSSHWVSALELEGTASDTRFQVVREQLNELWNYTQHSLNHIDTQFEAILPSDDESLSVRSEELAAWSQGFLYGFSLVDSEEVESSELPQIVSEIINDFAEIGQVANVIDEDDTEAHEANESALFEVLEYIKVSIQLVFEEMAGSKMEGRKEPIYVDPRYMQEYADDDDSLH